MARFCTYCGSPLEEGQVCSCPEAQAAAAQQPVQPAQPQAQPTPQPQQSYTPPAPKAPSPFGSAFKNLMPFCKAYLNSPVEATRSAVKQNDWVLGVILLGIQVIAAFLMSFSTLLKSYLPAFRWGGAALIVPFVLQLFFNLLSAAFAVGVFWILIFLAGKVIKASYSLKDALIATGANSMFSTALLVLAFLLGFASRPLAMAFFVGAVLVWILTGLIAVQSIVSEHESGKFWISYILTALATLLAVWLFYTLLSLVTSGITRMLTLSWLW